MTAALVGPLRDHERNEAAELLRPYFSHLRMDDVLGHTPAEWTFAVRENRRLAAVVLWRRAELLTAGVPMTIALAGPGATAPEHRGRRLLATHMGAFVAMLRDEGCVLSGLETPLVVWHRRNGWEVCSAVARYEVEPHRLRPAIRTQGGRIDDQAPVDVFPAMYEQAAAQRFGLLARNPHRWSERLERSGSTPRHRVAWQTDDGAYAGYLIATERQNTDAGPGLLVEELIALTPPALRGLLLYLSQQDHLTWVRWDAPADAPLPHIVEDPHALNPRTCIDKVLRVVDLAALDLPRIDWEGSTAEGLVLAVDDPIAPWNAGAWRVAKLASDRYGLIPVDPAVLDTPSTVWGRMSVAALSPLLSRQLTIEAAVAAGLVEVRDDRSRMKMQVLLGSGPGPYSPEAW